MRASRLPSLVALKAFESVGRHLSFQRAADELCLTPSAVSHQVRTLENQLGTRFFVRRHHELELTQTGTSYMARVQAIIADLIDATSDVVASTGKSPLTIQLCPSLAALWLMPRLRSFREENPELEINIVTPYEDPHFLLPEVDVGILYGAGGWTGVRTEFLMGEEIFPVCSPQYLKNSAPLKDPSDLINHTIVRCSLASSPEWPKWLEITGCQSLVPRQSILVHNRVQSLQAAIAGIGVSMARRPSVNDALDNGTVVAPFGFQLEGMGAYFLVYPEQVGRLPRISVFRTWVMAQSALSEGVSNTTPPGTAYPSTNPGEFLQ